VEGHFVFHEIVAVMSLKDFGVEAEVVLPGREALVA